MYDSRSDHPHKGVHRLRAERKEDWDRLPVRPRIATPTAIVESLDDYATPESDYATFHDALREAYDVADCEAEFLALTEPERMPSWEVALLTGMDQDQAEDVVWSSSEWDPRDQVRHQDALDDEDEDTDWTTWLTASPREFFDAVGDAWVFDGPDACRDRTSGKAGGYVRVYELAREVGISTADMVTALRVRGEYVANGLAYVALPVADRIRQEDLIDLGYAVRTTPPTWAEQRAEWDRKFAARVTASEDVAAPAKVARPASIYGTRRPGAPRPGNNPFHPLPSRREVS